MASQKRKSLASSSSQIRYDRHKFSSPEAWDRYTNNIFGRKIIPKRNVQLSFNDFEEFQRELNMRNWQKKIANLVEGSIDVALVDVCVSFSFLFYFQVEVLKPKVCPYQ